MRLASKQINAALDSNTAAPINFGLLFNKYLDYKEDRNGLIPVAKEQKTSLVTHYDRSNKEKNNLLKNTQLRQLNYCQKMAATGWHSFVVEAELSSPFVSGLGMSHPTETGLVLDHTIGVPYIPAASQKGVMRIAHIVNSMQDNEGMWRELDWLYEHGIIKDEKKKDGKEFTAWQEDEASKTLYGYSGKDNSLAGQLVIMDAYPLEAPSLGEDIINPHFNKYYGGNQGPTEDQSPVPVKFLMVKPGCKFVFRIMLRKPFNKAGEKDQEKLIDLIEKTIDRMLVEEGLGAKTALGFGRFKILQKNEPELVESWHCKVEEEKEAKKFPWRPILRKLNAITDWNWGIFSQNIIDNNEIKAFQGEKEIGQAVCVIAEKTRKGNPKKWTADRDTKTMAWLAKSGVEWHSVNDETPPADALSPEIQQQLDMINGLKDWGTFTQTKLDTDKMSKQVLKALARRMKQDWGCGR